MLPSAVPERNLPPTFLRGCTLLQSILTEKKASTETVFPKLVLTTTKALIFLDGPAHVSECMSAEPLHAKTQWKLGCCIVVVQQVVIGAQSALSKLIGVGRV